MRVCQNCCTNVVEDSSLEDTKICDNSLDKSLFVGKCKACISATLLSCDLYESIVEHQMFDKNIDAL